jgi:UDP-4-amino-4,6-dideoxy-N-acetyl-beta-L-altrosamine N-acetyltransferase
MIALRQIVPDDRDRLLLWRNAPHVAQYMYTDHSISLEEHARWFAGIGDDKRRRYWIIESNGTPVGLVNLYDIDERNRRCAWAFYLGSEEGRGAGVGSQVECSILVHVFETMGFNKLCCEVLASNEAVWGMHQKFGFVKEGVLRNHVWKSGSFQDVVVLGMTSDDWRQQKDTPRIKRLLERLQEPVFAVA